MSDKKGYITPNDLQRWIDHLDDEEKELPIVISEEVYPKPSEMLELKRIGHMMSSYYNGFVIVSKKLLKR